MSSYTLTIEYKTCAGRQMRVRKTLSDNIWENVCPVVPKIIKEDMEQESLQGGYTIIKVTITEDNTLG